MAKYKYMLQGVGYGGELVVGTVTEEFVRYWLPVIQEEGDSELIEHLHDFEIDNDQPEDALEDPDSPPLPHSDYEPGCWHELDDLEHINSTFADSYYTVTEIVDGNMAEDETQYELGDTYTVYGREAYLTEDEPDELTDSWVPAITLLSSEKGGFWNCELETDEPFDPRKLAIGVVETSVCEVVDSVWYDGKELDLEYDFADTSGKGFYANVGWFNKDWHDIRNPEWIEECINDWNECHLQELD